MFHRYRAWTTLAALVGGMAVSPSPVEGQMPLDLTFGRGGTGDPTWPWGWNIWSLVQQGYRVALDSTVRGERGGSLRVDGREASSPATALYRIGHEFANGRRLTMEGRVRVAGGSTSEVRLGLRARSIIDGEFRIVVSDSSLGFAETDRSAWRSLTTIVDLPDSTDMVDVEIQFEGGELVWIADLTLSVNGNPAGEMALAAVPTDLVDTVAEHAVPLATTNPVLPTGDLTPVRQLLGDTRYILLGESTHGTREFFQLKHRVVRSLVESGERVVIAMEDHQSAVAAVQDVLGGRSTGPLADAMAAMFAVWRREEMRDVFEWASQANRAMNAPVVVVAGVDLQDPRPAMDRLVSLLEPFAPEVSAWSDSAYDEVRAAWDDPAQLGDAEKIVSLQGIARSVANMLRTIWEDSTASPVLAEARRLALMIPQSLELAHTRDQSVRDRYMAVNLRLLGEHYPDARIVFWGHNGHTRLSPGGMGGFLVRDAPDDVVAFGLLTYEGAFRGIWPGPGGWRGGDFQITTAPPSSVEALLHHTGYPVLALDLRPEWAPTSLGTTMPLRSVGALPEDYGFAPTTITGTFHALLFVDRSTPAKDMAAGGGVP